MKMAKASEADINMAMDLANYCDSISRRQMPDALSNDADHIEWLDHRAVEYPMCFRTRHPATQERFAV